MPISTITPIQVGQLNSAGGFALLTPTGAGTVTPSANALVILLIGRRAGGGGSSTATPVQPSWAAQAWTAIVNTATVGTDEVQADMWWTIAVASPSAAQVTTNFSGNGFAVATGALWEVASGYHATTPIRQYKTASAATLAGNVALTGTFDSTPLSSSQLIEQGWASGWNSQALADPSSGWTKNIGTDEGSGQTSYVASAVGSNGTGFGGDFANSTPTQDHNGGAWFIAAEIQEASSTVLMGQCCT